MPATTKPSLASSVVTGYEPAARKGVECRLGGSILKIAFQKKSSVVTMAARKTADQKTEPASPSPPRNEDESSTMSVSNRDHRRHGDRPGGPPGAQVGTEYLATRARAFKFAIKRHAAAGRRPPAPAARKL